MSHPYEGLPDRQFWKRAPGILDPDAFDPVSPPPFRLSPQDRIVTAGSCFAQHVARHLSRAGFRHHITEKSHPILSRQLARSHNYGLFSARYGNIYTTRQLRQLIDRASGRYIPLADAWTARGGQGVIDPFRPQIQPGAFLHAEELMADRAQHLAATRQAFEEMDVFVFTLGLTEAWADTRDGAIFPLAPGVAGGDFDPATSQFINFDLAEVVEDLNAALDALTTLRPELRVILTVSPVPLNATYTSDHVWQATTLSKAILRLAAEECSRSRERCAYFPSYEIITSPHQKGRYFGPDRREVTQEGVNHVMGLFLKHFADGSKPQSHPVAAQTPDHAEAMQHKMDILCDEAAIDNKPQPNSAI